MSPIKHTGCNLNSVKVTPHKGASSHRVVEDVEVGVAVAGPGEADPLLLPARHVDPLLPDLGLVTAGQDVDVGPGKVDSSQMIKLSPSRSLFTYGVDIRSVSCFSVLFVIVVHVHVVVP